MCHQHPSDFTTQLSIVIEPTLCNLPPTNTNHYILRIPTLHLYKIFQHNFILYITHILN